MYLTEWLIKAGFLSSGFFELFNSCHSFAFFQKDILPRPRIPRPVKRKSQLASWRVRRYALAMKLRLVVEHDAKTKRWAAYFPELPGCASAGDTEKEAVRNAREALALWFEPVDLPLGHGAKLVEVSLP
jgi:predicted RNase H-like HicB family nuclease